ncbi:reverse transcriptase domain-containing protein [Anatilimnocola sp. NA78]|uniref:reverse transcriptase domain-containing protein n=1 Tax=Anatilimnocola sp. NA78 TaxID=3415683 RepID=UPI003CE50658
MIKKSSGRGFRKIQIANVLDRIIARAIYQWLWPWLEPKFECFSFGFRKGVNSCHALQRAVSETTKHGRTWWLCHDLANAFDDVPRNRLFDLLRAWAPPSLLTITQRLIDSGQRKGIAQGSPLSPLLLNVYLDQRLDKPWNRRYPELPLLRYADDLCVLCTTEAEAMAADGYLRALLTPAGFKLRTDPGCGIIDLQGGAAAEWLGFRISMGPGIKITLGETAWSKLEAGLQRAAVEHTPDCGKTVVTGWFDALGPCYEHEDRRGVISQAHKLAQTVCGLQVKRRVLRDAWRRSKCRWTKQFPVGATGEVS